MPPSDPPPLIRAAGGVVWRPDDDGAPTVLVIHRPRYDDWSLPKGKLDEGESFEAAAIREIAEETGVTGDLGRDLGEVRYTDHRGRPKVVRWYALRCRDQTAATDLDEVDEQRWLPLDAARSLLSYPTDVEVLDRFRATVTA